MKITTLLHSYNAFFAFSQQVLKSGRPSSLEGRSRNIWHFYAKIYYIKYFLLLAVRVRFLLKSLLFWMVTLLICRYKMPGNCTLLYRLDGGKLDHVSFRRRIVQSIAVHKLPKDTYRTPMFDDTDHFVADLST